MKRNKCQAWITVFGNVNEFMELNLDKWNTIDEIRRTYDEFINNLRKIRELQPELEQDLEPVRNGLAEKRALLQGQLFPLGNILEVYVNDNNTGKKARSLVSDWKKLESLGNHKLLRHSSSVHKLMLKYFNRPPGKVTAVKEGNSLEVQSKEPASTGEDIRQYGLTLQMLDELHAANQQYMSSLKLRDDVLGYRRKIRKKRDGLILANRKLLRNRLNKLMTVFSGTHPSFFSEYTVISDRKSRS